jgi:lipid-binding SYLF domain-containing protein
MKPGLKFGVDAGVVLGVRRGVGLLLARLRKHTRSYPSDVENLTSSIRLKFFLINFHESV